jgi:predicted metal-dependent hydrolase
MREVGADIDEFHGDTVADAAVTVACYHSRMSVELLRQLQLWNDGAPGAPYSIRESLRARRLSVRVFRDGAVEVVVPPRTAAPRVAAFLSQHRDWIERKRLAMQPRSPAPFPPPALQLCGIGEEWHCTALAADTPPRLQVEGAGRLLLTGRTHDQAATRQVLLDWLIAHGRLRWEAPLRALAQRMEVRFTRLQLRCQRTRWGSCSRRGTISLNCSALFQREPVLRYLLVHELAHLHHMNHSARFWACVQRFEPQWRQLDAELRQGWLRVPAWIVTRARTL